MFAEKIGESCLTTGTVAYQLTQTAYGAFRTWRSGFSNSDMAFYYATNATGSIWELGYGTFTTGTPDSLTRTLIASSSGALINWVTTPYQIYSVPTATALKHMLSPLVNGVANAPAWLPGAAMWLDYALGVAAAWVKKRYISGTRTAAASHAEEGRFYLGLSGGAANIFAASQRKLFVDKGAANYVFTADDIGKVLCFDCSAAVRTLTMLAASTAGMGHGAYVDVMPYGKTSNGVIFTPGGSDTTDLATAPPGRITRFEWDGAKGTWRADYAVPAGSGGFANKFRNGNMVAWPNGTASFNISAAATGAASIGASGWSVIASGAAVAVAQSTTGANGASLALQITGNTSVTGVVVGQRIESMDAAPLAGGTVTVQAAIRNDTGGPITPSLSTHYPGATDDWTTPAADLAATAMQACPNGATTIVSYTFAAHANATRGYQVKFDFGNNFSSNAKSIKVTALDIRATPGVGVGLNAAPPVPEFHNISSELARCARYHQASYENGTAPGTATKNGIVTFGITGGYQGTLSVNFPVEMRAAPTVSYWDGAGNASKISYIGTASTTFTDNQSAFTGPFTISKKGFIGGSQGSASATNYGHYAAYSDFW